MLGLLVGIELQFAVGPDDVAGGRLAQPFAAAGSDSSDRLASVAGIDATRSLP